MDAVEYKNGPKNQWRRIAWNVAARHTPDPRAAVVLYLPGSTDLDRPEALRRGFKPANLIAIERDAAVAEHLRDRGVTVIVDTLNEVLRGWPARHPVAGVIADFQCGLSDEVVDFIHLWSTREALRNSWVIVNTMRGRDAKYVPMVNETATTYETYLTDPALDLGRWLDAKCSKFGLNRNRGQAVAALASQKFVHASEYLSAKLSAIVDQIDAWTSFQRRTGRPIPAEVVSRLARARETLQRERQNHCVIAPLPSYRSNRVVFDSVLLQATFADWRAALPTEFDLPDAYRTTPKIRAALAIRTRRLRGELRSARYA